MNDHESNDQDMIDLLAENELDAAERQRLFERLDLVPNGWKRCALTLLETQALKLSLGLGDGGAELATASKPPLKVVKLDRAGRNRAQTMSRILGWMVAAVLLVSLGFMWGDRSNPKLEAGSMSNHPSVADPVQHASQDSRFLQLAKQDPELLRQLDFDPNSIGGPDVHVVAYIGTQENNRARIYPIVESEELTRQLADMATPSLPVSLAEKLKRSGWEVESQKQILSIPMPDGNRRSVPVGTLNYRYVGRQTY